MSGEPITTIIGNLAADPELRFTPAGVPVCNFTIAQTPRNKDRVTDKWVDGETIWVRCAVWRDAAENAAESLSKGMRVIAHGRLKVRSYDKDGEKRTAIELEAEEVGPSTRFAQMKVRRIARGENSGQAAPPVDDPWGSAPPARSGADIDDEPPF